MQTSDIITIIIAVVAFLLSLFTAYRTFWAKFKGNVWFSNRVVLSHVDNIPSLGFALFIENSGAIPGILDDLRAKVVPKDSGTTYYFYPILMRNDYSIFKSYNEEDWFPFSMISLQPNSRLDRYLLLKPQNDKFGSIQGDLDISLEVVWHGTKRWVPIKPLLTFSLNQEIVDKWNDPKAAAIQINANDVMLRRRL